MLQLVPRLRPRTLVIKGMRQLVPHDHAHGPVVERVGVMTPEQWRLQDAGWKHDVVPGVHQYIINNKSTEL